MLTMREVLENLDVLLVVLDPSGKVIYSNKSHQEYLDIINKKQSGEFFVISLNEWVKTEFKEVNNYQIITIIDITESRKIEEKLRKHAFSDYLTGLVNRGGIIEYLNQIITEFDENGKPFGVVLADIDLFKIINDTYGHRVGDDVLKEVSAILRENIRSMDFVGRYGGEEFLIILKQTNYDSIKESLERIRTKIEKFVFEYEKEKLSLTMTFGVHLFNGKESISSVIEKADQALYYGKETGRNKVVIYDEVKELL